MSDVSNINLIGGIDPYTAYQLANSEAGAEAAKGAANIVTILVVLCVISCCSSCCSSFSGITGLCASGNKLVTKFTFQGLSLDGFDKTKLLAEPVVINVFPIPMDLASAKKMFSPSNLLKFD